MTHLKTLAVSLIALAAIAVPATALDHRDHGQKHNNSHYTVDLNVGNLHISSRTSDYRHKYQRQHQRPSRVYIAIETSHHPRDNRFSQFQSSVRRGFARASQGSFQIVASPRHADFVVRLNRDDWGMAYKRYIRAASHGRYPDRYELRAKVVDQVSRHLLSNAYEMRQRFYRHTRYDKYGDDRRHSDYRRPVRIRY